MLRGLALVVCAGCGASLGSGGNGTTDGSDVPIDSPVPIDAPIDARPCTGGDKAGMGPDGSCFIMFNAPKLYTEAKASCDGIQAHLAILKTAQDDMFAEQFVGALDTYIGLTDLTTEGTFVWDDGTPLVFKNWALNEPNNGSGNYQEDCAIIAGARPTKQWDDRPCVVVPNVGGGNYATLCQF
jgi:Lectin C-type domain